MDFFILQKMLNRNSIALIYIGFGSIISQILLLRVFFTSFYGNELSIGIVFSSWLIWTGIGSITGNKILGKSVLIRKIFPVLIAKSPIITILQIIAVKFIRLIIPADIGVYLTITDLFVSSFFILSIGCFVWGFLFTTGAKILLHNKDELWLGVNKAYCLESIGSVIGGIIFSLFLSSYFSTFQIAFLLLIISWFVAIQFIKEFRIIINLLIFVALSFLFIFTQNLQTKLDYSIDKFQWKLLNEKLAYIKSEDTKYQNLAILKLDNQYSIYANGKPAHSFPNTYSAEYFVHSIMIQKSNAENVLVIAGGFNGILQEILKYPFIKNVDYLEIDSILIKLSLSYLPQKDIAALNNNKVNLHFTDGRSFIRQTKNLYDVIILNVGDPSTASQNRFFTLEFFEKCKSRLTKDGIIAFSLQSSAEYMSNELRQLNASIYHTAKNVFDSVMVIPGDKAVFLASSRKEGIITNPDSLAMQFEKLDIHCDYFTKYTYWELMQKERIYSINNLLYSDSHQINTDNNPIVYFFDLQLWNKLFHDSNYILTTITPNRIFIACGIIILLILVVLVLLKNNFIRYKFSLFIIITLGGFLGMALNLLLLLNFQQSFGSIYELVGLMIAGNIFGLAVGSILISFLLKQNKSHKLLLILISIITILIIATPLVLKILIEIQMIIFTVTAVVIWGILIGALYGLVNYYYLIHSEKIGSVYAYDIFGASVGALLTCSLLLPLLGINHLVYLLLLLMLPIVVTYYTIRELG